MARLSAQRAVVVRAGAVIAAALVIARWPSVGASYGPGFWLWAGAIGVYALSFARATDAHPAPSAAAVAGLLGIVGLGLALRLPAIEANPANISIDELLPGLEAARIARGGAANVFSSVGWFSMPNLSFAFPALVMKVLGQRLFLALRVSSMLTGVGGLLCTFLLARRLLGDRAALSAGFLMAVSFWHIHNSRTGFPFVQSSFWTALVMYLVVRARQDRSRMTLALAGVCLGLALQCYFPIRVLIVLCPLFVVAGWWSERSGIRTVAAEAAIIVVGALLVLGPLLTSVPWAVLCERSRDVLLANPEVLARASRGYQVQGLPAVLHRQLVEAVRMFSEWADVAVLNRSPAGLLDVGTLAALVAGILLAVVQGRAGPVLLVVWAAVTFVFGVVLTDAPRASYRLAAAMPALFSLAGFGVERVLLVAAPPRRWYRLALRPVLIGVALWVAIQNYRLFFVDYAKGDGHETTISVAMRLMSSHCDGRQFYFLWREPPGGEVALFCPAGRALDAEQVPSQVETTRAATFMVAGSDSAVLNRLHHCYPSAEFTEHRAGDGRFLLTSVDVQVPELVSGRRACLGTGT